MHMQSTGMFLLKILVRSFSVIPFRLLYFLSDVLYILMYRLIRYRHGVIQSNLRKAFPAKTKTEIDALTSRYYRHLCDILLESIKGLSMTAAAFEQRFVYKNPEIFDPLFERNQSAILLGAHYGNWEWGVLSFPLAVRHQVVGIYKPLKNPAAENYLNRLRKRFGLTLTAMSQAGRAMAIHRNEACLYVLIADQTPSDVKNAHWLSFLHQDTPFLHGPDKLGRRTDYPVFIFTMDRVKRGFYEVTFKELTSNPGALPEAEITKLFASELEKAISAKPELWLWSHRRWKRKRSVPQMPASE